MAHDNIPPVSVQKKPSSQFEVVAQVRYCVVRIDVDEKGKEERCFVSQSNDIDSARIIADSLTAFLEETYAPSERAILPFIDLEIH